MKKMALFIQYVKTEHKCLEDGHAVGEASCYVEKNGRRYNSPDAFRDFPNLFLELEDGIGQIPERIELEYVLHVNEKMGNYWIEHPKTDNPYLKEVVRNNISEVDNCFSSFLLDEQIKIQKRRQKYKQPVDACSARLMPKAASGDSNRARANSDPITTLNNGTAAPGASKLTRSHSDSNLLRNRSKKPPVFVKSDRANPAP